MVSIPLRTSPEQADAFVCKNAQWIHDTRQKVMAKAARDNADLPDKETALAYFTAMSDQVYPAFAGVLGGQKPTLKVRSMTTRWGVCCPGKSRSPLHCSCTTCRLRRRSMWWCTNTATFAGQPQPGVLGRGGKAAAGLESPAGAIEEVETGGRLPLENEKSPAAINTPNWPATPSSLPFPAFRPNCSR